jgi:parallel beta-helix repeat protein
MRRYLSILVLLAFLVAGTWSVGCMSKSAIQGDTIQNINPVQISGPLTISKPGYYQIMQDIVPQELTKDRSGSCMCINIKSPDVLIDGMGHTVDGIFTDSSCQYAFGFFIGDKVGNQLQYPNVIIRNVTATHWSTGILLSGAHEVLLESVTLSENKQMGLEIVSSSGITVNKSTIIKNKAQGILSEDSENIVITDTTIAENSFRGINMMGILLRKYPVATEIFGRKITITELFVTEQKTSGNGYEISHDRIVNNEGTAISIENSHADRIEGNNIAGNRDDGIDLTNIDNAIIRDNTISSCGRTAIFLWGCGSDLVLENNTLSGNSKDIVSNSQKTDGLPPILFGTFFIVLLSMLSGTITLATRGAVSWVISKVSLRYPAADQKHTAAVQSSRFSRLFTSSATVSVAGAIILGGVFTYSTSFGMRTDVFLILTVIGGIVTIIPKIVQYLVAREMGLLAAYRMWWSGILVMLATTLLFRNVFGQPVRTEVVQGQTADTRKMAFAMLAGPVVSILLSSVFLLLYLMKGTFASLALLGMQMSLLSSLVLLLPVAPMDGKAVFRWNKAIWAVFFFPVLFGYGFLLLGYIPFSYFTATNLAYGAVAMGILCATGFCLWRTKTSLAGKHFKDLTDKITGWVKYLIVSVVVFVIARILNLFFSGYYSSSILGTGSPLNRLIIVSTFVLTLCSLGLMVISSGAIVVGYLQKIRK